MIGPWKSWKSPWISFSKTNGKPVRIGIVISYVISYRIMQIISLFCFQYFVVIREVCVCLFMCCMYVLIMLDIAAILEPFILRRLKSDVLKDLPKKSEVILYHGLSSVQKNYYKAILRKDVGNNTYSCICLFLSFSDALLHPVVDMQTLWCGTEPVAR